MNRLRHKKKNECCGCTACKNICPVNAIHMEADEEGFLYPQTDENKCSNCGLCDTVCSFNENYIRCEDAWNKPKCIAAIHRNANIRNTSRSGGAFMGFSEYIIKQNGFVYGVALDKELLAVHIKVSTTDMLQMLQGSKYIQSDKENAYSNVRSDLMQGKGVLFSGTPCEVSGLLSYLKYTNTNTQKLYTCDLICHGTASTKMWQENLKRLEINLGGFPEQVDFRDKRFGWRSHIESYKLGNKRVYSNTFTTLYNKNVFSRPACANCQYCNTMRCGDITLADAWGIEKAYKKLADNRGTSLLLINSDKGSNLMKASNLYLEYYPLQLTEFIQPNLEHPTPSSLAREEFWQNYKKYNYKYIVGKYYDAFNRLKLFYNIIFRRFKK